MSAGVTGWLGQVSLIIQQVSLGLLPPWSQGPRPEREQAPVHSPFQASGTSPLKLSHWPKQVTQANPDSRGGEIGSAYWLEELQSHCEGACFQGWEESVVSFAICHRKKNHCPTIENQLRKSQQCPSRGLYHHSRCAYRRIFCWGKWFIIYC